MLGRFSTVLQNAVDALAPPAPLHEDFAYHWKKLMKHYLDVSTKRQLPIELTNIPAHFEQLLKILIKEDEEKKTGETGPCLEYLLQHNLLDLLVTLAASDDPPGMRQHVLEFVSKILTQIKSPIAGHMSVYPPLQRLVGLCDGSTPTPTEGVEVQFLLGLIALVRRNPQLVALFTVSQADSVKSDNRRNSCSSDASSQFSIMTSGSDLLGGGSPPVNNPLFSTPIATSSRSKNLRIVPVVKEEDSGGYESEDKLSTDSPPTEEGLPMVDAILSYVDTADSKIRVKACHALMLLVSLPDDKIATSIVTETLLTTRLASRLAQLFLDIPDSTDPNHIDDMQISWGLDTSSSLCMSCQGCRHVASFLSWYDFCNQVMIESNRIIGLALGKAIQESFLEEVFPLQALTNVLNITLVTKCFRCSSSTLLTDALCKWLAGPVAEREMPGIRKESVRQCLLDNWISSDSQLVLETLRLFEVVLEKGNEHLMDCLVYAYLKDRSYIDKYTKEDEEEPRRKEIFMESVIQGFLSIVPYELRTTSEPHIGYEQYISESQRQYSNVLATWKPIQRIKDEITSPPPTLFYEGPFLRTLFDSIRNIPNQEYEINLELTAVVSRLALSPDPQVHEFLLESVSLSNLKPEASTLHNCLSYVATLLADSIVSKPGYKNVLAKTRSRLLGVDDLESRDSEWCSTFESVVVVDELCKELAAISYVKLRHTS